MALSSISFPSALSSTIRNDYRSLVDLDFMYGLNLSMDGVKDHNGDFISRKEYWIKGDKMKYEMGRKEKGLSASLFNLLLPEDDWEVALASISFPDMVPRVDDFIDARVPILVRTNIPTKIINDDGVPIPVRRWINNRWQTAKDKKGNTQYWHNAKYNAVVDLQKSDCAVFPTTVRGMKFGRFL